MSNTPETRKTHRLDFDKVGEEEQIARFKRLSDVFSAEGQLIDFFQNVNKYLAEFKIKSIDGGEMTYEEKCDLFEQAKQAVTVTERALQVFLHDKKSRGGFENEFQAKRQVLLESFYFSSQFNIDNDPEKELDVDRLSKAIEWSLNSFKKGAEKIGRDSSGLKEGEVKDFLDDLQYLLESVNNLIK